MKTTKPKAVLKSPAKAPVKTKAAKNSQEAALARVEAVRMEQRKDGHFDCFARATEGYCDQGWCIYYDECLSVSRLFLG